MGLKKNTKVAKKTAMLFSAQEDDAGVIRHFLRTKDIEVEEWNRSGLAWITKWQRLKPYIVFVDYLLTRKDGIFIMRNIHHYDPEQYVVFMHGFSGFGANEVELTALKMGAKAILQKPLTEAKLRVCVDRLLEK